MTGEPDPDLDENLGSLNFLGISGLWEVHWRTTWISTILSFQGGAIHAIWIFCPGAGCRKADLLTSSLGRLWATFGPTLGQLWAEILTRYFLLGTFYCSALSNDSGPG